MTETDVIKGRRHAIYALVAFCAVFFVGGIIVSYAVAANYGYGTGFGDGNLAPIGTVQGQGFFGDSAILGGAFILDVGILYAWYWLVSRLEAPADDDPLLSDDGADLSLNESWYFIQVPNLTRVLIGIAVFCTAGVAILAASILPVVLLRYGW
ncbi:MAG: hypothetical protein WBZ37_14820 [Mycobacterium sp.]